jgi:hypothetical protein
LGAEGVGLLQVERGLGACLGEGKSCDGESEGSEAAVLE